MDQLVEDWVQVLVKELNELRAEEIEYSERACGRILSMMGSKCRLGSRWFQKNQMMWKSPYVMRKGYGPSIQVYVS